MQQVPDTMTATERRASIGLASIYGLRMLGLFIILPIFAIYAQHLPGGDSHLLIGIALGAYGLTQAILQIPAGWMSDRYGRKPVIYVSLILFAVGSFIAARCQQHLLDHHRARGAGRGRAERGGDGADRRPDPRGSPHQGDGDDRHHDRHHVLDLDGVVADAQQPARRARHLCDDRRAGIAGDGGGEVLHTRSGDHALPQRYRSQRETFRRGAAQQGSAAARLRHLLAARDPDVGVHAGAVRDGEGRSGRVAPLVHLSAGDAGGVRADGAAHHHRGEEGQDETGVHAVDIPGDVRAGRC